MSIETEERGPHTIVRLAGVISVGVATQHLDEVLSRAERDRWGWVVVDLTSAESLDSTALGLLVGAFRRLHSLNREIMLINPNERITLLLTATQLDSLFPIYKTLMEALDAVERKTGGVTDCDHRD